VKNIFKRVIALRQGEREKVCEPESFKIQGNFPTIAVSHL
jgi:hypothetical protein